MTLLARLLRRKDSLAATLHQDAPVPAPPAPAAAAVTQPEQADALLAEGSRQLQQGDADGARETLKRVLERDPKNARAFYLLSGVATQDGDIASAIGLAQRALSLAPAQPEFHVSLGSLHAASGDRDRAIESYQAALRLKPDVTEWQLELAGALSEAGRLEEAVTAYRAALRLGPPDADAWFNLGFALQALRRYQEAEEAFLACSRLAPDRAEACVNLAMARRDQGTFVEAEPPARRAVELAPALPQAWFVLGNALTKQGRHLEAIPHYRKAVELLPDYEAAWSALLMSMNYEDSLSPREIYETHLKWGRSFPAVAPAPIEPAHAQPGHRLRIGYLSADLREHAVAYFLEPILRHHDGSRFEVFAYHVGRHEDAVTARLKSLAARWRRPPADLKHDELEKMLRADRLDILVELSGHTDGQRLAVLARRVAPVQVTYLGYPNTTGLHTIDYRITDGRADPPGEADALHVEKLVRLPQTFLCYSPPTVAPVAPLPPCRQRGYLTFGSFNNFAKISAASVALWSRVLLQVPGSKLALKHLALRDPGLQRLLHERFRAHGVAPERVVVMPPRPAHRDHLDAYSEIDVALDTVPYNGTTTTIEALWMGVPVVALEGDRHAARVGVSLLSAVGMPELIAHSQEEYVAIAAQLASQPDRLEQLRHTLRSTVERSPLADGARFTQELEQAYQEMWRLAIGRGA
jgi:predicted O-linked N-acetylglucosamine transferase (SPINDLY family)